MDHGKRSPSDKRLPGAVEELRWEASIKPSNMAIPAYEDAEVSYEEIEVFAVTLRDATEAERIAVVLHKVIPYPVVMCCGDQVSVVRKRRSQAQFERMVVTEQISAPLPTVFQDAFLASLAISKRSSLHLQAVYEGWVACVVALQFAGRTGQFFVAGSPEALQAQRAEQARMDAVQARIRALKSEARRERSLQRQAELNLEVKRLEGQFQSGSETLE